IYSDTIVVFQGFVVGLVVVSFVSMIIATIRGRDGAVISLLGSIVFFITAINDVLYALQVIYTTNLVPWGLIVFVFVQAFIMSRKSSSTFSKVEELSERLLALDKLKDDFLANTSHELRTPLNGIIGIAESLLGGAAGQLNNQQRYNLHLIVTSGKRLACLVKDILDFLRLKNKDVKIYKRPVDLRQVAAMVLELSRPLLGEKRIELRNEIDESIPLIYADENRLEQILHNLLGNAIKFTHEGKVTLSACVRGTMGQVNVADTGIGIPKTMFAKIFNPFEQVDSSIQREYGGTGLGLNITKSLVELHGGEMNLESEVGCGSMFSFTIPVYDGGIIQQSSSPAGNYQNTVPSVEEASFEALAARHPLNDSQPSFKILVVDDEAINVQVLSNQLALSNYRVVTASNGEEALKIIQESHCEPFNLIILDIMMPKVSGFEVCRILRKKYSMLELPVLMLTAKDQPEDIAAGYEAGANDYLAKPFNKSELLARVNTLLTLESSVKFSIANARKLESEWTGRLMAERINDFTKSLTATLEPEEVAKRILSNILDIVPSEKGLIILRDGDNFKVAAVNNQDSPLVATGDEIKARDSKLLMELMETLKPVIRNDSVAVLYPKDILLGLAGSVIGIPVIYNGIMSGSILLICKSEGAYKDFEYSIEIASNFANQAGIAIENARLFAEVRKLAVRDGLTGLYSRRHFFQLAEQEFNKSRRYSSPFTIVMLDIDYFKRINDTYGHNVGDEVLKHVSQKCSDSVRKSDIVGRYGGEELIILLPETEIENAKLMAEKLRKTIEEAPITDENGNKICVTASFGVAMVTGNTASLNDAIIKADMGLYEAKRGGRNKVVAL
ncbi:MAG: diguanylate cyclase, partial [Clostridia bacterium]|nr:diguanylate cyclase [Clostridia bacterium]